jgi:DNA-binding transcriptional LysR family regulator
LRNRVRCSNGVSVEVLTPAGQRFYEQVSAGLSQIANAAAALKQHASLPP